MPREENYYGTLFPKIAELALKLPNYVQKVWNLLDPQILNLNHLDDNDDKVCPCF